MKEFQHLKIALLQFTHWLVENYEAVKNALPVTLVISGFGTLAITFGADIHTWWEINEWYIKIVLGTVAADHVLGSIVHSPLYKNDFSILKNIGGFGMKLFLVVVMGALFEGLSHLTIEENVIYTYLKMVCRLIVLFYPFRSACLNSSIISGGAFPPIAFINRVTGFQRTLDLNKLKNNTESENEKTE